MKIIDNRSLGYVDIYKKPPCEFHGDFLCKNYAVCFMHLKTEPVNVQAMLIMSGRLARDCEVKEGITEKGRPYAVLNNCVFVNNKELGQDVPMNITAWGEHAKFIHENFKKGDSIQLAAQETPHTRKAGEKEFTECIFTVRKVLDWDMYINTVKFLGNTLSRLENSFTERSQEAQKENQDNQISDEDRTDTGSPYPESEGTEI